MNKKGKKGKLEIHVWGQNKEYGRKGSRVKYMCKRGVGVKINL